MLVLAPVVNLLGEQLQLDGTASPRQPGGLQVDQVEPCLRFYCPEQACSCGEGNSDQPDQGQCALFASSEGTWSRRLLLMDCEQRPGT